GALQLFQPHYYAGLYAQAHAHRPLYTDPLSATDADWPTTPFALFQDRMYVVQPPYTPLAPTYDNALFEVTGRTFGNFDLGGVGFVILDRHGPSKMLWFRVTPSGEWWLDRLAPTPRGRDHTGVGNGQTTAEYAA